MTTTRGSFGSAAFRPAGAGWITFATVVLGVAGTFNVIDGIVGLARSKYYVGSTSYVFSDLRTWGWIVLVVGALEIFAALYVTRGSEFARWFGVGAASLNGIAQLMFLPAYPLWAISAFTMDILIVYGLIVYGGARLKSPA